MKTDEKLEHKSLGWKQAANLIANIDVEIKECCDKLRELKEYRNKVCKLQTEFNNVAIELE